MFMEHELIKKCSLERRKYQVDIFRKALKENILCVLPTGLGKTVIALLLAAEYLKNGKNVLVLAPTKPLVEQHRAFFKKHLNIEERHISLSTGSINKNSREKLYKTTLVFATPQTILNDMKNGLLDINKFSLIIFDEAHHAIGKYAYTSIANAYNGKVLALTASPSAEKTKIKEICRNLKIKKVEIVDEKDESVKNYVKERRIEWVFVDFPDSFKKIRKFLVDYVKEKRIKLISFGISKPISRLTKRDMIDIKRKSKNIALNILLSKIIKVEYMLELLETQGIKPLFDYIEKMINDKSRSSKEIISDNRIREAFKLIEKLKNMNANHPKLSELCKIVKKEIKDDEKIIIFANYRKTTKIIANTLRKIENTKVIEFYGQREGMTQKEQKKRIEEFRKGIYNILIGTSISEEGLDIPSVDIAIFYEPIPSEIRFIQRKGRVGRVSAGKIIILITKGTRDEAYYWSAVRKEKKMKKIIKDFKKRGNVFDIVQKDIKQFTSL